MSSFLKKIVAAFCAFLMICNFYMGYTNKVNADVNQIQDFVERNYEYILNRHSDPQGLATWTNLLQTGQMDAASVVIGFLDSEEYTKQNHSHGETVEILYRVMLSRTADPDGYNTWTGILDDGMSYSYLVNGFSGSQEFKNLCASYGINPGQITLVESRDANYLTTKFVSNCYSSMLGRPADRGGLNDWTLSLNNHTVYPEEVIRGFINSPECVSKTVSDDDFIVVCYKGILGRAPSNSEVQSWKDVLATSDRAFVIECFIASEEFSNTVAAYGMTFRPAPAPGYSYDTKMVALTFDDGPYSPVTNRILDVLEAYGGHATFFVVGNRVPYYTSCVTRAESLGCEVGNHTYDHRTTLTNMSAGSVRDEIVGCNNSITNALGHGPVIMRPVGGAYNATVCSNVDLPMINWSLDTQDWKNRNTDIIVSRILNNVRDGDIILMHDLYPATAAAMEIVIPELVRRGYTLVTVSELAEARGVDLQNGTVYTSFRP